MDVRIGVIYTSKEIEVDLGDSVDQASLEKQIEAALGDRADKPSVLWLSDKKGRKIGVPAEKIAYIEIGSDTTERRVGFVG